SSEPSRPVASPLIGCRLELAWIETRESSGTIRNVAMPHAIGPAKIPGKSPLNPQVVPLYFHRATSAYCTQPRRNQGTAQQTEAKVEVGCEEPRNRRGQGQPR